MALLGGHASFLLPRNNIGAVAQGILLSPTDCESIINYCLKFPIHTATVGTDSSVDTKIRKNFVRWIPWDNETEKVFALIRNTVFESNQKFWGMDLAGYAEQLQFTQYTAGGDHYDWHTDIGDGVLSLRKLSVTIQLSDPETYQGGDLELRGGVEVTANRDRGNVTIFPSWMPHRVTPVTKGERFSLVVWISGPPFR